MRIAAAAVALAACSKPAAPTTTLAGTPAAPAVAEAGPVGTPGPMVIEASDPDGRWVVACQARTDTDGDGAIGVHLGMHGDTYGDRMTPYVIVGGGAGEPIDAFVDQSQHGTWIAAIADDQLVVIDGRTGARTVIADADVRDDAYPSLGPRAAAFAGDDRLVFMRHTRAQDVVVTRDLRSGTEHVVQVAGEVWRVEPDAAGAWASVLTVRTDTDRSGALQWPTQHTSLSARGCRGPIGSYGTYGAEGDEPDTLWVELNGVDVIEGDDVVAIAGPDLVRITPDKALAIGQTVVLPAGCDPTVRATSATPPRVLAGCGATKAGKIALRLVGAGVDQDLKVEADRTDSIRRLAPGDRLACIEAELCVDMGTGALLRGPMVYADADRVLVQRGDRFAVIGAAATETALGTIEGYPTAAAGPVIAIGKTIVDLSTASIRGVVDGEIAAVDRAGRALVTTAVASDTPGPDLPGGPARWIAPK